MYYSRDMIPSKSNIVLQSNCIEFVKFWSYSMPVWIHDGF